MERGGGGVSKRLAEHVLIREERHHTAMFVKLIRPGDNVEQIVGA